MRSLFSCDGRLEVSKEDKFQICRVHPSKRPQKLPMTSREASDSRRTDPPRDWRKLLHNDPVPWHRVPSLKTTNGASVGSGDVDPRGGMWTGPAGEGLGKPDGVEPFQAFPVSRFGDDGARFKLEVEAARYSRDSGLSRLWGAARMDGGANDGQCTGPSSQRIMAQAPQFPGEPWENHWLTPARAGETGKTRVEHKRPQAAGNGLPLFAQRNEIQS